LRFDKDALEKKLRKFAAHCQHLEDERASIIEAIRPCSKDNGNIEEDVVRGVVSLCDRLNSLEEECNALANAENRATSFLFDIETFREKNLALQTEISSFHQRIEKLLQSDAQLKSEVSKLRNQRDELHKLVEGTEGNADRLENETSHQIRYLEQENLQLMMDLKTIRKQVHKARAENTELRMNILDDATENSEGSSKNTQLKQAHHVRTDFSSQGKENSTENEVARMSQNSSTKDEKTTKLSTQKHQSGSAKHSSTPLGSSHKRSLYGTGSNRKMKATPVLGEIGVSNDENTQECKQS